MSNQAYFEISLEVLAQALALPENAVIDDVRIMRHVDSDVVQILISHPDIPESPGALVQRISPIIKADYSKRPATWLTFDLNLQSVHRE